MPPPPSTAKRALTSLGKWARVIVASVLGASLALGAVPPACADFARSVMHSMTL